MEKTNVEYDWNWGGKRVCSVLYEVEQSSRAFSAGEHPNQFFARDSEGNLIVLKQYLDGEFKEFDKTGRLVFECNYIKGLKHGESLGYHKNGKVWYKANYIDDKREGEFKEWDENGALIKEVVYKNNNCK